MNLDNLNKLIAALEAAPDEKLDMRSLYQYRGRAVDFTKRETCGTAACIAGWCGWLAGKSFDAFQASDWLDLWVVGLGQSLFCPPGFDMKGAYTRLQAIAVLKHLRDTGEVVWDKFDREGRRL